MLTDMFDVRINLIPVGITLGAQSHMWDIGVVGGSCCMAISGGSLGSIAYLDSLGRDTDTPKQGENRKPLFILLPSHDSNKHPTIPSLCSPCFKLSLPLCFLAPLHLLLTGCCPSQRADRQHSRA